MSDSASSPAPTSTAVSSSQFTERELQLLGWAMQSLKSGPPEIDNVKLAQFASMSNPRSAGNAWNALKKKLMTPADPNAPPPTPKRGGGRKKKVADGEDVEATPKTAAPKTSARKRAAKQPEDGDGSPKKKGRPSKAAVKQEAEDEDSKVKSGTESPDSDDIKPEAEVEDEV